MCVFRVFTDTCCRCAGSKVVCVKSSGRSLSCTLCARAKQKCEGAVWQGAVGGASATPLGFEMLLQEFTEVVSVLKEIQMDIAHGLASLKEIRKDMALGVAEICDALDGPWKEESGSETSSGSSEDDSDSDVIEVEELVELNNESMGMVFGQ
jgi:hypothetical protein